MIQGGTISIGTLSTVSVAGAYWMQLHQLVFEDHLAGRRREIAADLEMRRVGLPDAQLAAAGLDVLRQHVHAAREVLAFRRQRVAQQFRIGEHEVRRRDRVDDLAQVELGLLPGQRIEPLGVLDQPVAELDGQQIGLLEEVEELVRRPFRIGEALVARVGLRDRIGFLAGHAPRGVRPEVEIALAERRLQLERALRVGEPVLRHLAERLDHVDELGMVGFLAAFLARLEIGGQRLAALFDHAGEVVRQLLPVGGCADAGFRWGLHVSPRLPCLPGAGRDADRIPPPPLLPIPEPRQAAVNSGILTLVSSYYAHMGRRVRSRNRFVISQRWGIPGGRSRRGCYPVMTPAAVDDSDVPLEAGRTGCCRRCCWRRRSPAARRSSTTSRTSMGGLPEGTPARPATPAAYPAVHDMPPAAAGRRAQRGREQAPAGRAEEHARPGIGPAAEATGTTAPAAGGARNP